tara:strand:+ start:9934 stop:10551 length:618 start_codon:yes stop_codon:yes gene_type:complete
MNIPSISYAVTTHNEGERVLKLIDTLLLHKSHTDEVVVLDDYSTDPITKLAIKKATRLYMRKFENDFAEHKNYLNGKCRGDYIVQFDGDELPTKNLLKIIPQLVSSWPETDLFWIPRENKLYDIDMELIRKWNWNVDELNRINYPDYQGRIYKNQQDIKWTRPLHELITGHKTQRVLRHSSGVDILHHRHMEEQIKHNSYYDENF